MPPLSAVTPAFDHPTPLSVPADPALQPASAPLRAALERAADDLLPTQFPAVFNPPLQTLLRQVMAATRASESAVWVADPEQVHLVPVVGLGPLAPRYVQRFAQPLASGLVSMVYDSGQSFCENDVESHPGHSPGLDLELGMRTRAMMAVPLHYAGRLRGVLTAVHLAKPDDPPGGDRSFAATDLATFERVGQCLRKLIDLRLIEMLLGWEDS